MIMFLEEWDTIDPSGDGLTCARVIDSISRLGNSGGDTLREALEILAPANSRSRTSTLGYRFREYLHRQINGKSLEKSISSGLTYWYVKGHERRETRTVPVDLGTEFEVNFDGLPA